MWTIAIARADRRAEFLAEHLFFTGADFGVIEAGGVDRDGVPVRDHLPRVARMVAWPAAPFLLAPPPIGVGVRWKFDPHWRLNPWPYGTAATNTESPTTTADIIGMSVQRRVMTEPRSVTVFPARGAGVR
jgi:hypothetical protein